MGSSNTSATRRMTVLGWLARRAAPSPAGLRPLHARISADVREAAARIATAQRAAEGCTSEPHRPSTEHRTQQLTAVVDPGATSVPRGRYTVTVRLKGTSPEPIEVKLGGRRDLAAAVAQYAQARLGRPVDVTVDPPVHGGDVRAGQKSIGTFTYKPTRRTS